MTPLPSENAEAEEVAVGGDGVDLVADGLRLRPDDGDPVGAALEADHRLVDGEVPPRDELLREQLLALVVEGCGLLDDVLALTARDRGYDVAVAVELSEAVAGHELRGVVVAVAGLPVVVQLRKDDDALTNSDSPGTATSPPG